jgi:hypothetical protein
LQEVWLIGVCEELPPVLVLWLPLLPWLLLLLAV